MRLKNVVSIAAGILLVSVACADAAPIGPPPEAKLKPPHTSTINMAASKDGTTVVTGDSSKGNVFVWVRGTDGWADARPVKLRRPAGSKLFGLTVAVSPYGSTIVATTKTAAYVFARPAGGWSPKARSASLGKQPGDPGNVAVTAGAREIFVSGEHHLVMFERVSRLKYLGTVLPYADFSAVSDDGRSLVAVGNSVKLFVRSSAAAHWPKKAATTLDVTFLPSDVALSRDGRTVVVGLGDSQDGRDGVLVFAEPEAGWARTSQPTAQLTAENPPHNSAGVVEALGGLVAISGDGSEIVASTQIGTRALLFRRALDGWHDEHETEQWNLPGGVTGSQGLAWSRLTQTMVIVPDGSEAAYVYRG